MSLLMLVSFTAIAGVFCVVLVRYSWIVAQPDECLLRVRNGKVVDA